ncbi:helix-turn-helix transcriptional regulator [Tamlana sp. I1]|uniref:helix-turn-helix transcriptional regulator n=1 Tax=Tamlana sp. I1 TaxID=2762061 RepID=UPI00189099B9|nr:hypothetical protein [Tamlana sp. I1]
MIDFDALDAGDSKTITLVFITADKNLALIDALSDYDIKTKVVTEIPQEPNAWEIIPETIIIDSTTYPNWQDDLSNFKTQNTNTELPIIVLTDVKTDATTSWHEDYICINKNDKTSLIHLIFASIKCYRKLNNALIKTNQLNRILSANYQILDTKNECLESIQKQIKEVSRIANTETKEKLKTIDKTISENLSREYNFLLFKAHFEEVHPLFFNKLLAINPKLTNNDLRLAAFIKMGFNNSEICLFTGVSMAGVKKAIQRLRIRLELKPDEFLRQYIFTIES